MPSITFSMPTAATPERVVPREAGARFSPMSSSRATAWTYTFEPPGAYTWNAAVSLLALASAAAAKVTACHTFQFTGVKSKTAPF